MKLNLGLLTILFALIILSANPTLRAQTPSIQYYQTGEEFNGPFASWKNVKTDYGAKGDGVTDDTAAITSAIEAMKNSDTNSWNVLYFPAGTYIISSPVAYYDRISNEYSGMKIVGEDPATTIIRCSDNFSSTANPFPTLTYQNSNYFRDVVFSANGSAPNTGTSLFTNQTPAVVGTDGPYTNLGMKFQTTVAGTITQVRYYRPSQETGSHTGELWTASGNLLAQVAFTNETSSGWQVATLATPVAIAANVTYIVSVNSNAAYAATTGGLAQSITNGVISSVADGANGVYTSDQQDAMFRLDATYGNISRLTFDGRNKVTIGLLRDGVYGTDWRITDLFFQNLGVGLQYGGASGLGEDLTAVTRCHFLNCGEGLKVTNQNCLGIETWFCLFQNCGIGIDGGGGFAMPINNVFLGSTTCDLTAGDIGYPVLYNTSVGSNTFLDTTDKLTRIMAQGNKIYNTTDPVAIHGVDVMLDNTILSSSNQGPAIQIENRLNTVDIGNTTTVPWPTQPAPVPQNHGQGGYYFIGNPIQNAIDGNPSTFFYHGVSPLEVRWNCPAGTTQTVTSYSVTPVSGSAPTSLQFYGSNDFGFTWNMLDSRNTPTWTGSTQTFTINNTAAYNMYRIVVAAGEVADVAFLNNQGVDITKDPAGFVSGIGENFGQLYQAEQTTVKPSSLPVPTVLSLPGVPANNHRTIFEVQRGTGNDSAAIQAQINAAAALPAGSNPIVHLTKGTYNLTTTVVFPPSKEIQLVGDGALPASGTNLTWGGSGTGPCLLLQGPSRVVITDLGASLHGTGSDFLTIQNADQPGGRIYCDQVDAMGNTAGEESAADWTIDGIEQSDVTVLNQYIGISNHAVSVTGGPVLGAGGSTNGQVTFLNGYYWSAGPTSLSVQNGGRLTFAGYRNEEGDQSGVMTLNAQSSGSITYACNNEGHNTYDHTADEITSFNGTLCTIANSISANSRTAPVLDIQGDGSQTNVLSLCNLYPGGASASDSLPPIWNDQTSPLANAGSFLDSAAYGDNIYYPQVIPNIFKQASVIDPPTNSQLIAKGLAQLRAMRLDAPVQRAAGVTDVKIIRSFITVDQGRYGLTFKSDPSQYPVLTSAVSRFVAGSNNLDLPLALTGAPTIEPRTRTAGSYQLVLNFSGTVTSAQANLQLQSGQSGTAIGTAQVSSLSGSTITVNLSGVASAQRLDLHLTGIAPGNTTVDVPINILPGDTNGDGYVTAADVNPVKTAYGTSFGQAGFNLRADINGDGYVTAADVNPIKNGYGSHLP